MSNIESKVKEIISEKLGVAEDKLTSAANFTEDLGADSLDVVEVVMEFEKHFGINIPDNEIESIQTVGEVVKYIEQRVDSAK